MRFLHLHVLEATLALCVICGCSGNITTNTVTTEPSGKVLPVIELIGSSLVDANGGPVSGAELIQKQYLLLYFSAHWCPPCRAFTPQLVNFYNQNKNANNFEIILISADRTPEAMRQYMSETAMPWPALSYDSPAKQALGDELGVEGIPCLVMFNNKGAVISSSYKNKKYVGPDKVLNDLKELLKKNASAPNSQPPAETNTSAVMPEKQISKTSTEQSEQQNKEEDISLLYEFNGVLKTQKGYTAIINGKLVSKGDTLDNNAKVVEIADKYVVISIDEKTYKLKPSSH